MGESVADGYYGGGHLASSKRPVVTCVNHTPTPQLASNFDKKDLWSLVDLKDLTFSMIFQKHISP